MITHAQSNIQQLTLAAMVAAVYFVLCYFGNIFQLTFGPVQVRLGAGADRAALPVPCRRAGGWHWAAC